MKDVISGIVSSVISALLIALAFFAWNDFVHRADDLTGAWEIECEIKETSYSKYEGMKTYFDVLINQQGTKIVGTGEKVAEIFEERKYEYEREKRVQVELTGKLENRFISGDEVQIHWMEHGRKRKTSTVFSLRVISQSDLRGNFFSTAADAHGRAVWRRKELLHN